jgi:hypothetical protein
MYVYNVGIIDHFNGLTHLNEYIKKIKRNEDSSFSEPRDDLVSLQKFVVEALCEALNAKGLAWEGDLRNNTIFVGGIPISNDDLTCKKFLVIKQNNNGSTFVISPIPFGHLKDELIDFSNEDQYGNLDELPYEVSKIIEEYF